MIGAEIFIEPGQKPEEIETWFLQLKQAGMNVTRIRLFETYMRKNDGSWDFTLFDTAYLAAEKYGIKVYGNLFPATDFTDLGGLKFPRDDAHFDAIAEYVKQVVPHFKQFKSCYGWVPVNEPGVGHFPQEQFAVSKYEEWKTAQTIAEYNSQGYDRFDFADERFHLHYNTWFLQWLTNEILKYQTDAIIHVNNHAIFKNVAEYDFTQWREFLTSLGGSAHASWHFEYFNRQQYALAVSANCEIIRSGAGNIPWFMTELQGGNNTYSGFLALCPTAEEIAQWLWIAIATESKGAIFWCLNPRSSGIEAGEWAMLNYHNEPSDRLMAATAVTHVVNEHINIFEEARALESGINILYTRESLWVEKKLQTGGKSYPGRDEGGVMKSAIAYFEALSEMGIQSNFKETSEFDFSKTDYRGITIILAHQISIPSKYWPLLTGFVANGGTLIADGLTAYYDENAVCLMRMGFPLRELFGADVLEYKAIDNAETLQMGNTQLPAYQWKGLLKPIVAKAIGTIGNDIAAVKNQHGKGHAYWLPTMAGLCSRIVNDYSQLNSFLSDVIDIQAVAARFNEPQPGILMKTLTTTQGIVTVIVNESTHQKQFGINLTSPGNPVIWFANKGGKVNGTTINISAEETMVISWI
ncbi:beta-galactosidase trimerization domain-containing protein [Mucilaginibacter sp.]|uniref:beta-galactosidase trimerization domain-containing protein n=1 Tax=Mucilaginibacter sp. TaxID=1882438 RepID=UPI0035BC12BD